MSTTCQRFEQEGLERLQRGEPLDAHFRECADCVAASASYQHVTQLIGDAYPVGEPAPDFEAKVWASIARQERTRRWRTLGPGLLAATFAAALTVLLWPRTQPVPSLTLSVRDGQTEAVRAAGTPKPGDVLVLRAAQGGAKHAELRVYRDGLLVMRCDGAPACEERDGALQAQVPLSAIGRYEVVLVHSDRSVDGDSLTGALNADVEASLAAGAQVVTAPAVQVF